MTPWVRHLSNLQIQKLKKKLIYSKKKEEKCSKLINYFRIPHKLYTPYSISYTDIVQYPYKMQRIR